MKHHLKSKNLMMVTMFFLSKEAWSAVPGIDLESIRQQMEASKSAYLEKKSKIETKQQKAQENLAMLQKESEVQSANLLKSIQDESTKREDIQKNVEALKRQLQELETAKLEGLKTKRQALAQKHQENHRLRQILLKIKRFYGEKLTQLYAKG